jgi:hypothetical protein
LTRATRLIFLPQTNALCRARLTATAHGNARSDIGAYERQANDLVVPAQFDFDGDGRADLSVFVPVSKTGIFFALPIRIVWHAVGFATTNSRQPITTATAKPKSPCGATARRKTKSYSIFEQLDNIFESSNSVEPAISR